VTLCLNESVSEVNVINSCIQERSDRRIVFSFSISFCIKEVSTRNFKQFIQPNCNKHISKSIVCDFAYSADTLINLWHTYSCYSAFQTCGYKPPPVLIRCLKFTNILSFSWTLIQIYCDIWVLSITTEECP
jgi:hypothetical protein